MTFHGWLFVGLLVADVIWLFVALRLFAGFLGGSHPLVSMSGLMVLLFGGYLVGRTAPQHAARDGEDLDPGWTQRQAGWGLVAIWVAIALAVPASVSDPPSGLGAYLRLDWPWLAVRGALGPQAAGLAIVGFPVGVMLWRRGLRYGLHQEHRERAVSVFWWGATTMCIAALVEQFCACGLLSLPLAIAFFIVALGALALSQVPHHAQGDKTISRWIMTTLVTLSAATVALGLLGAMLGESTLDLLGQLWNALVEGVVGVLAWVLSPVLEWLVAAVHWLRTHGFDGGFLNLPKPPAGLSFPLDPEDQESAATVAWVLQLLAVLLIATLATRALMHRYRSRFRIGPGQRGESRENLSDEEDPGTSFGRYWVDLIASRFRSRTSHATRWSYPRGLPGITEAYEVYYQTLDLAERIGVRINLEQTPNQRLGELSGKLPNVPVREITTAFNAACYAERPTNPGRLKALEATLKQANKETKSRQRSTPID